MSVQRYSEISTSAEHGGVQEDEHGLYCFFSDYQTLEARLREVEGERDRMKEDWQRADAALDQVVRNNDRLKAQLAAAEGVKGNCEWKEWDNPDNDGQWDTSCNNTFTLICGTPYDNDMRYCPYCGKLLTVRGFLAQQKEGK
jgi:hypothetical protein